jgi:5-formyltetrahydrofolate cyclo-ligase
MDASAVAKAGLRARLLAARRARPPAEIGAARTAIAAAAIARSGAAGCVAAYEPMRTEPGSAELLDGLLAAGCRVLVPILAPSLDLDWAAWEQPARPLGVTAIASAGFVFVPALAVDGRGNRLGRGGGSYDRALGRVTAGVPVVALLYDDELVDEVPVDVWDRPVTGALTPSGWHWFPGR